MGETTHDDTLTPHEDDIVLSGTDIVVRKEELIKRYQVTITCTRNYEQSLDNIVTEAPESVGVKDVAFNAVKEYLVKRFARPETRLVFRAILDGVKPQMKRLSPIKYVTIFNDAQGEFVNDYTATVIEI